MKEFLKDLKELIEKHEGKFEKKKRYVVKWRNIQGKGSGHRGEEDKSFSSKREAMERAVSETKRWDIMYHWVEEL